MHFFAIVDPLTDCMSVSTSISFTKNQTVISSLIPESGIVNGGSTEWIWLFLDETVRVFFHS